MDYNFFMVGGDMRNYILAEKLLKDGNNVKVLGFEKIEEKKNIIYFLAGTCFKPT